MMLINLHVFYGEISKIYVFCSNIALSGLLKVIESELQIRGGIADNSKTIFLFLNENISCDPSLEPSR